MPLNVGAVLVFDKGGLSEIESYDRIMRLVVARIHKLPHFRKKIVNAPLGLVQPYWVEDLTFSVSSHVHLAFPNREVNLDQVLEYGATILPARFDRSRPLWDLFVIPRVEGNRLVVIAKLHHAIIDGVSGMQALASMFDLNEEFDSEIQPVAHTQEVGPSQFEVTTRTMLGLADHVLSALSIGVSTAKEIPAVLTNVPSETVLKLASDMIPVPRRTGATSSISAIRKIVSHRFRLSDVKEIAGRNGVKVNDVLLTLSQGALVGYLKAHELDLPEHLVGMVPVSVHEESGDVASKNKVSALFLTIPTTFENSRDLLSRVHAITDRAKAIHSGIGPMFFYNLAQVIPPVVLEALFRTAARSELFNVAPPLFNYVVSNVPGPNFDLFMAGNRLERMIPLAPVADGSGITFAYLSYKGMIDLGLTVDPNLYAFAEEFPVRVDEILTELLRNE